MSKTDIEFLDVEHGSDRYRETLEIRDRILRAPLGLEFTASQIEAEKNDIHLIAFANNAVIACLVLTPASADVAHFRQVAVIENHRGEGIGTALTEFAEHIARQNGFTEIKLHAREEAVPFYERLGYQTIGNPFIEVTIPHREMRKPLDEPTGR